MELPFPKDNETNGKPQKPISPLQEMVAYEVLWRDKEMSFKKMAKLFASKPGMLPSDFAPAGEMERWYAEVKAAALNPDLAYRTNLLVHGAFDYPVRLREAEEPVEMLYYAGNLDLLSTRSVAVVGTRKPTLQGVQQAQALSRFLVRHDFTVLSGLAAGIDTAAHRAAIDSGGHTIAVIGTPLDQTYPAANADLQKEIAHKHLLLTQVPFIRYREQSIHGNKLFFPERNKTMSALSEATVIVEAGATSGTLIQARAALYQGRKLFILDACFRNPEITWPATYEKRGAIRVRDYEQILHHLPTAHVA